MIFHIEEYKIPQVPDPIFRDYLYANSIVPQASDIIKIIGHLSYFENCGTFDINSVLESKFSDEQLATLTRSLDNQHQLKGIPYLSEEGWSRFGDMPCYRNLPSEARKVIKPEDLYHLWSRVVNSLSHNLYYFIKSLSEGVEFVEINGYGNNLQSDLQKPYQDEVKVANSIFENGCLNLYVSVLRVVRNTLQTPEGKQLVADYKNEFFGAVRKGSQVWREAGGYREKFVSLVQRNMMAFDLSDPILQLILKLNHLN